MTSSRSPRWKDGQRLRKIAYDAESAARDTALLMDLRYGIAFNVYPCRWGDDYRDGEIFPVHWHVGHPRQRNPLTT